MLLPCYDHSKLLGRTNPTLSRSHRIMQKRPQISLFQTWRFCTYRQIQLEEVGLRAKNKMIEIFNLELSSSMSRDEMQTKHPCGGEGYGLQDPAAGPLRHRQSLSCLISSCRSCLMLLCAFYSPREYVMTMINVFLSMTPFKEQSLIFWGCDSRRVFVLRCQPCSMFQEIVCVSGYGSQWHNEIDCLLNARGAAWMCVWMDTSDILYFLPHLTALNASMSVVFTI